MASSIMKRFLHNLIIQILVVGFCYGLLHADARSEVTDDYENTYTIDRSANCKGPPGPYQESFNFVIQLLLFKKYEIQGANDIHTAQLEGTGTYEVDWIWPLHPRYPANEGRGRERFAVTGEIDPPPLNWSTC